MSSPLPPVPQRVPMIDPYSGYLNPVWADWFQKIYQRVGGSTAYTNDELAADDFVTFARMQNISTDRLIGRDTAATGSPEEITVSGGLEWTGSGGIQRSALTGDVTATAGSNALSIPAGTLAFVKMLGTDWTNSTGASGYQKLPTGVYVQWGVTTSLSTATTTSIGFPIAFPTACRQVLSGIQGNSAGSTAATGQWGTGNYSTTAFDLYNRTSAAYTFNWLAIGS